MSISKIKLQQTRNLIDDMIDDLKLELSYLEASKKQIVTLEDKLGSNGNSSQTKTEETSK